MRVIFTGQAGVKKDEVFKALRQEFLSHKYPYYVDAPESPDVRRIIAHYTVEEGIKKRLGGSTLIPFLETYNNPMREKTWRESFEEVLERIKEERAKRLAEDHSRKKNRTRVTTKQTRLV